MTLTAQVLTDVRIYMAGADLTGWSNKVDLASMAADEKITNFASGGWEERTGGLFDTAIGLDGFFEAADAGRPDDAFWANLGVSNVPISIVPTSGAAGQLAYLTRVMVSDYKPGGSIGKVLGWSASTKGTWPVARGQVMHPQGTARIATGTGTGYQLGAVLASQRMYCNLNALSIAGTSTPTITVKLQSSVDNTFASPTDRITFTAVTVLGGQASSVLGAITDQWWRAVWSISGASPSFLFSVTAGIAPK